MKMRFIDPGLAGHGAPRLPGPNPIMPFVGAADHDTPETKIPWAAYWRSIKARRWLIIAAVLIATALGAFYAQSIRPLYRSTTTLLIESGKAKILSSIEDVYSGASQDREYYQTQVEILRSRDVALRTVTATRLWDEPEFDPRRVVRNWRTRLRELINPPPEPAPWTPERLAEATVGKYIASLSIEPVRLSQLVKISFDANDATLAARIADATATSFIDADRDARLKLNLSVNGLLQERLMALRDKLRQSEQDLQQYRETAGLVAMSGSQGVASQELTEINQRLVAARVRRTELESAMQQASRAGALPSTMSQPGLAEARARVSMAQLQFDEVSRTLGERHTRVIEAKTALAEAQRQLQAQSGAAFGALRAEAQAARETERSLQAALGAARSNVQGVNRQEFQLGVLEREVQTNKQLYELFLNRTKETSVSTNLQAAVARIVDPASVSTAPLSPNKAQIVMVALLLTLSVGCIGAVAIDRLNNTLRGSDEAELRLRVPVLASLPAVRSAEARGLSRAFVDNPRSPHANAIRSARTSILLSRFDVMHKLVLVTSALSGEGKTTFCTNLAFAHAQTKRTLLIDCDTRDPQLAKRLGLPEDAKGISNLVLGNADLKECVHAVPGSTLLVMPAGSALENPEEFLLSPAFRESLKALANRVDIVLIDSPPVAACSDALILSQQVNDTIYVVKARDTPHLLAMRGLERLHRAGASILGVVLTNVDADSPDTAQAEAAAGYAGPASQRSPVSAFGA